MTDMDNVLVINAGSSSVKFQLFGIPARDPLTFAIVPMLLALVAVMTALIPARRAARIDPMTSLRDV